VLHRWLPDRAFLTVVISSAVTGGHAPAGRGNRRGEKDEMGHASRLARGNLRPKVVVSCWLRIPAGGRLTGLRSQAPVSPRNNLYSCLHEQQVREDEKMRDTINARRDGLGAG
jgi:hypothetical protein